MKWICKTFTVLQHCKYSFLLPINIYSLSHFIAQIRRSLFSFMHQYALEALFLNIYEDLTLTYRMYNSSLKWHRLHTCVVTSQRCEDVQPKTSPYQWYPQHHFASLCLLPRQLTQGRELMKTGQMRSRESKSDFVCCIQLWYNNLLHWGAVLYSASISVQAVWYSTGSDSGNYRGAVMTLIKTTQSSGEKQAFSSTRRFHAAGSLCYFGKETKIKNTKSCE